MAVNNMTLTFASLPIFQVALWSWQGQFGRRLLVGQGGLERIRTCSACTPVADTDTAGGPWAHSLAVHAQATVLRGQRERERKRSPEVKPLEFPSAGLWGRAEPVCTWRGGHSSLSGFHSGSSHLEEPPASCRRMRMCLISSEVPRSPQPFLLCGHICKFQINPKGPCLLASCGADPRPV